MAGIIPDLPGKFVFKTEIPVRITDINYGNHVGNDAILSLIHEARVQYLNSRGYRELDVDGVGLIMKDAAIEFKNEVYYGDRVIAHVTAANFTKVSFDLFYRLERKSAEKDTVLVIARTRMVCYNYKEKKIAPVPPEVPAKLSGE